MLKPEDAYNVKKTLHSVMSSIHSAAPRLRSASLRGRIAALLPAALLAGSLFPAVPAHAQDDVAIPGIQLGLAYENLYIPPLAVLPFTGPETSREVTAEVQSIITRDLDFSDRFVVLDSLPEGLADEGIQYSLWDQYGADWVLVGDIGEFAGRHFLSIELHDIVFTSVERGRFPLPPLGDEDFRMAVHRISDSIVGWVTGDPGPAASRILFAMRPFGNPTAKELYVVDSDGENLRRVTWDESIAISPTWAPDGRRAAYVSYKSGVPTIYELDMADGGERTLAIGREGQQITPAYHPNGQDLAFTLMGSGLFRYNLREECCLAQLVGGRANNIQPAYSPDGDRMIFVSNRLGDATPQVYMMPAMGGEATLLSPYRYGQGGYFADPDWSAVSNKVAFAGGIVRRRVLGRYHIFVADPEAGDNRLIQLTREGNNEDPSWGPDGRHIVFAGERSNGFGVFVVDSGTGRTRTVVASVRASDTDWSPALAARPAEDGGGNR